MERQLTCEADVAELLGAYALDAVDDQERHEIERYLITHAAARLELARLRAVVKLLPLVFGPPDNPRPDKEHQ